MRHLIFVAILFFSLAPSALAATQTNPGTTCTPGGACLTGSGRQGTYNASCVCQQTQTNPGATGITLINPLSAGTSLESFLMKILEIVIRVGTIVVILMVVYVGFMFVTARGEPGKLTTARQALLWTVVGALILLGAQAIAIGIKSTVSAITG